MAIEGVANPAGAVNGGMAGWVGELRDLSIIGADILSLTGILRNWPALRQFKLLPVDGLQDISALSLLENLEVLQISYCEDVHDFSVLGQLPSLYSLWLQGQIGVDLSVLSGDNCLQDLTIAEGGTVDVRPLANNENLTIFVFEDTEVADFAGERFLPTLLRSKVPPPEG